MRSTERRAEARVDICAIGGKLRADRHVSESVRALELPTRRSGVDGRHIFHQSAGGMTQKVIRKILECPCMRAINRSSHMLQVIKTRLQLQGELQKRNAHVQLYRGVLHAFYQVAKHDGINGLQKGLVPAFGFQFCLNSVR